VLATIWGSRGSLATPGRRTVRYGGNTSCVEIRAADGALLILDAGTGIRELGLSLGEARPDRIDLLLSHLHIDHLEGLPYFSPIWDPSVELHIWGPSSPVKSLEERIATYLSPPLFPVHLAEVPSKLVCHDSPREWELGSLRIASQPISHPGPTLGYRIHDGRGTLAYLTDHEPALGMDLRVVGTDWISGYTVAHRADVLLHDCQYTEREYDERVGWGHSSTEHVATFAELADVDRLLMFHHDPMHSDDQLEAMLARVRDLRADGDEERTDLAGEGLRIELSS
jgi:phosphoribosyl 1,2-cyclic phosphodiesterase